MRRLIALIFVAGVYAMTAAAQGTSSCAITSFVATTSTYAEAATSIHTEPGDSVALLYKITSGCKNPLDIAPGLPNSEWAGNGSGGTMVSPKNTTTYTLTACDATNKCVKAAVTINVEVVCTINDFYGTTAPLKPGASGQISWNTSNCSNLSVKEFTKDGEILLRDLGPVTPVNQGTLNVQPSTLVAEYILTANDGSHPVKMATTIVGYTATCSMQTLTASPATIISGGKSTLTWTAVGTACNYIQFAAVGDFGVTSNLNINPYCPDATHPCTGTITVTPRTTTTFMVGIMETPVHPDPFQEITIQVRTQPLFREILRRPGGLRPANQ